jgi:uncharacterized protein DUF6058
MVASLRDVSAGAEPSRAYAPGMLTDRDLDYIRDELVPLADLCRTAGRDLDEVRRLIAGRTLPAPPYPGVEAVPADYFDLPDAASFVAAYDGEDVDEDLAAYLDGTYFVCLRRATPANIVRKGALVDELRALLAESRPDDAAWAGRLRAAVDELDALERPFSPDYDRSRFGRPPTRDELIAAPRRRWPELFAGAPAASV